MSFWYVIVTVALILVISLIILWISEVFVAPAPINPVCVDDGQCQGNVCQDGVCKAPISGPCSNLSNCVNSAVACSEGRCVENPRNGIGMPCPCQEGLECQSGFCRGPVGITCLQDRDCTLTSICFDGVCVGATGVTAGIEDSYYPSSHTTTPARSSVTPAYSSHTSTRSYSPITRIYRGYDSSYRETNILPVITSKFAPTINAVDVIVHHDNIYVLFENGEITRVIDHIPSKVRSNIDINSFFVLDDTSIYGIRDGRLYILSSSPEDRRWEWREFNQISGRITGYSATHDRKHVWLETLTQGFLYNSKWELIESIDDKKFKTRNYGTNNSYWVDVYTNRCHASDGKEYHINKTICFDMRNNIIIPRAEVQAVKYLEYKNQYLPFLVMSSTPSTQTTESYTLSQSYISSERSC